MNHLHSNALRRAAEILGGVPQLADYVHASPEEVDAWIHEIRPAPMKAFFDAVEILAQHGLLEVRRTPGPK